MEITHRIERVTQSILENEAVRGNLDDATATALFDWLLPQAEVIARSTEPIEDDEEANEVMHPRLKAMRKLAKQLDRWLEHGQEMTPDEQHEKLQTVIKYVETMYGEAFTRPDACQQEAFLKTVPDLLKTPERFIQILQQFIKGGN